MVLRQLIQRHSLLVMVAGLLIWSAFFLAAYIFAAIACEVSLAQTELLGGDVLTLGIVALMLLALALIAAVGLMSLRGWMAEAGTTRGEEPGERRRFISFVCLTLCSYALIATLWVALPAFLLSGCT